MQQILYKKVPAIYVFLFGFSFVFCLFFLVFHRYNDESLMREYESAKQTSCSLVSYRKPYDSRLTRPLIMSSLKVESYCLQDLKKAIQDEVISEQRKGNIDDLSLYLQSLNDDEWISISADQGYHPGSLFKLPVFICYLKKSESMPGLLSQTVVAPEFGNSVPNFDYGHKSIIVPGGIYTMKTLLEEMIIHSDNYATMIVNNFVDRNILYQLFVDLGIKKPELQNLNYSISPRDYSKFFEILYNSTYLNSSNSEYALQILAKSSFNLGITKQLPKNILCSHKYGEFSIGDGISQFHEAGVVYRDDKPYLLVIMTQGRDVKKMPVALSDISKLIFDKFVL